jgi:Chaperone of endosialidase
VILPRLTGRTRVNEQQRKENDMKRMTNIIYSAAACFALLQTVQAVVPPPDGGYPGGNTAEGQAALLSLTTGAFNTAVGYLSLRSITQGQLNTAVGAGALLANTGDVNTATGAGALLSNTFGGNNTANGVLALFSNTTGASNTATGSGALFTNTTASNNTASGFHALFGDTTGPDNTATGNEALEANTTGGGNTANGTFALLSNTTGGQNTGTGISALHDNVSGMANTAVGWAALFFNNGNSNTALGAGAGQFATTSSNLICIGDLAGQNVTTANNVICIGTAGENAPNSCYIGNIFNATSADGSAVFVNSNGKLGTSTSSQRFKEDIKAMDKASEGLLALKPVTFRYKKEIDPARTSQFGLVAEEVEKVNPDLIVRDKEGKPYSVRYDQVNAMLLDEFLKEHRTVQELRSTVQKQQNDFQSKLAQQQKQIEALTAGLQKVSAQLEMSKPAPQTVQNNR